MSLDESILRNFGGVSANNLLDIISYDLELDSELSSSLQKSSYYTQDDFINIINQNTNSNQDTFSLLSLNCQSIRAKYDCISIFINELDTKGFKFDVICLQETWLNADDDISLYMIDHYKCIAKDKHCSEHGGLMIFMNEMYDYDLCTSSNSQIWEGLFIKIINQNYSRKNIIIGNIYKPPKESNNANIQTFLDELDSVISRLNLSQSNLILAGDFNINLLQIKERNLFNNYFEMLLTHGFVPQITLPTRFGENSCTLIDNIFTNFPISKSKSGIIFNNISDHLPCFFTYHIGFSKVNLQSSKYTYKRFYNDASIHNLYTEISCLNIMNHLDFSINGDPNNNYTILESLLTTALDKVIPLKKIKYNKHKTKKSSWITYGIIKSIKFRDNLYKSLKTTLPNTETFRVKKENLKIYNKLLKKVIKDAKIHYYRTHFEQCKNDSKKTWKVIKNVLHKSKSDNLPDSFIIDDQTVQDRTQLAEKFNQYFSQIGSKMASKINPVNKTFKEYLKPFESNKFTFCEITEDMTLKLISQLNNKHSYGYDNFSTNLLKKLAPLLSAPLTLIINQSLHNGIFPEKLKIGKIIPIFKKGSKNLIENYRPISLLPSISKIFERVIFDQLSNHFSSNKYFYDRQYGFRKSHSTEYATLEFINKIISYMDSGNTPIAMYLDLSKAFDTIDHNILLHKLNYYGIENNNLSLFKSYLQNRQQYVELQNQYSSQYIPINIGIPQGSILGPLLFIIYINDFHLSTNFFDFILYADDTCLINSFRHNKSSIINKELQNVYQWLSANKLSINTIKTKFMIFHNYQKNISNSIPLIKVNNQIIERVKNFNLLGININEHLQWKYHSDTICKKISRSIGILHRLKNFFPLSILKTLYNSLILPHINYGLTIWGYNLNRIFILQKKAIRLINKSKYNCHTDPLFYSLKCLKVEDIFKLNVLKFYYNHCHENLPACLQSIKFNTRSNIHSYYTRSRNMLHTMRTKTKVAQNCLNYVLPNIVNETDALILEKIKTHSLHGYCTYIKQHYIKSYNKPCTIDFP